MVSKTAYSDLNLKSIGFLISVCKKGHQMDLYSFLIYIHLSQPSVGEEKK